MRRPDAMNNPSLSLALPGREQDHRIGALFVDRGMLTLADAERVLHRQHERGIRFGEAAMELGLVTPEQMHEVLASQFDFPVLSAREARVSREVIAAFSPDSPAAEALRALRSQLMLRWFNGDPQHKALAIVSPGSGDGRTYLAANLAVMLSQLGERVMIVDADLRKPRLHEMFGVANVTGLSSLLAGLAQAPIPQTVAGLDRLSVLTAGPIPPNPQELLAGPALARLIAQVRDDFDAIILDTSPGVAFADADAVCRTAGAALMVVRSHATRLAEAKTLATRLRDGRIEVVGSVMAEH